MSVELISLTIGAEGSLWDSKIFNTVMPIYLVNSGHYIWQCLVITSKKNSILPLVQNTDILGFY